MKQPADGAVKIKRELGQVLCFFRKKWCCLVFVWCVCGVVRYDLNEWDLFSVWDAEYVEMKGIQKAERRQSWMYRCRSEGNVKAVRKE